MVAALANIDGSLSRVLGNDVKIKRTLFAWYDAKAVASERFRVSLFPADAPVRPSVAVADKKTVLQMAEKKRAQVYWWPPLPMGV